MQEFNLSSQVFINVVKDRKQGYEKAANEVMAKNIFFITFFSQVD